MSIPDASVLLAGPALAGLDLLPDPTFLIGADGRISHCTPLACRLVGAPLESLRGEPAARVLKLRDEAGGDWWERQKPLDADPVLLPRISEQDLLLHLSGDRTRAVALTGARVAGGNGKTVALLLSLRRAETRRRRDQGRTDLVSTVSHELRSPLTSVKGFTKTLLAKWDRFTDDQKKQMLATVNEDADRVTRLLGELLAVSRIDAGRLQLKRQMIDVGAVAAGVAERLAMAHRDGRRVTVDVHVPRLYADPDRVEQVFTNLLENAYKYTEGPIAISAEINSAYVRFTVADSGPGIPPEYVSAIFTKFFRRPGERTLGTGLGLYITKGLVEAHGGEVWVDSQPDSGARFHFTLPQGGLELAGVDVDALPRSRQ